MFKLPPTSALIWLAAGFANTIKSIAACARIHCATGTFNRLNPSLLAALKHFDGLRRALDVPDADLLLLAVSATAIVQPLDLLKIRRWVFLFI